MTQILILRGAPASGKSTFAAQWVSAAPRRVRVNRDDLRMQMFGAYSGLSVGQETAVTHAELAMVRALVRAGNSVVVDDTNIHHPAAVKFADIAVEEGVEFEVRDFDVPLSVCLERNAARDRVVPEGVIRKMHDRFVNRKPVEARVPVVDAYVPDESLRKAFIFDIDGTLAKIAEGGRSPYDESRVLEDLENSVVSDMARHLNYLGYDVLVLSGRGSGCREDTVTWLYDMEIPFKELHMRTTGDSRKDSAVKFDLFAQVRNRYNVIGVFDDRAQVVNLWRRLGLTCFQVDYGDF